MSRGSGAPRPDAWRPPRSGVIASALVALALALAGCSIEGEAIRPPTDADLAKLNEYVNDLQWGGLQFSPDSPRPTVEFERYVDPDLAEATYSECMEESGYVDWQEQNLTALGGAPVAERLALYTCITRFPIHPGYYGLYTPGQLDAIYDFYRDSLVPCISASGIDLGDVPTREVFVASGFFDRWSPYGRNFDISDHELAALYARCPDLSSAIGGQPG